MKWFWSKVSTKILDDPEWGTLSDSEWRRRMEKHIRDKKNIRIETDRQEYKAQRSKLKRALFSRDKNRCNYCGSTKNLEIDHIIPLARGGTNDLDNLQILCRSCNRRKWAKI